jgi:magnesium transporter
VVFAGHHAQFSGVVHEPHATSIVRDIAGLSDHGNHLAGRVNFLLDATLGMISIEQNGFFRVLSVASLIFMPPTLVAGVYGMNFKLMPELEWQWGYPIALGIMLIAAILPMAYLRQRKLL